jgi:uncharacterized protein
MNNTLGNFLGMLALAAALVIGAFVASSSIKDSRADSDITVTGSHREAITSDLVQWKGSLVAEGSNLQQATADLKKNVERLKAFVAANSSNVTLELAPIGSESLTYERTNADGSRQTIPAYRVRQRVQVESSQVQEVTALAGKTAENMLSNGIPFEAELSYLYTKLADLRIAMLEKATADAKKRAEVIAKGAGVGIGAPRNARVGVFQITPKNNPSIDDYGTFDTSSIEKEITAVVSVAFALK